VANDREKLDGFNGLLLSPHLDHHFDRGYFSFSDDEDLVVSRALNPAVLQRWGLAQPVNVGAFETEQRVYLAYHRQEAFENPDGEGGRVRTQCWWAYLQRRSSKVTLELRKTAPPAPPKLRALWLAEKWLQDRIEEDPSILGLGDLQLIGQGSARTDGHV
jgi:hypothetical protein